MRVNCNFNKPQKCYRSILSEKSLPKILIYKRNFIKTIYSKMVYNANMFIITNYK